MNLEDVFVGCGTESEGHVIRNEPCGEHGRYLTWCRNGVEFEPEHCIRECNPEVPTELACGRNHAGRKACPCVQTDIETGEPCERDDDPLCRWVAGPCDDAPCEGEGECYANQRDLSPCGINANGIEERQCGDGTQGPPMWGPWSCEDRDTCVNGMVDDPPQQCGENGNGSQTRVCLDGQWTEWSPCVDPTERCVPGKREDGIACGINGRGVTSRVCGPDGRWQDHAPCADPDSCRDDAWLIAVCGQNGRGLGWATCRNGQFVDLEECDDPDACFDADPPEVSPCADGVSARVRVCDNGQIDVSICHPMCQHDADCFNGAQRCQLYGDIGVCAPASCDDGRRNGAEDGVDCGGPCEAACPEPAPEQCNGIDDDADGRFDEDIAPIPVTCDPDEPMRNACAGQGGEGELRCADGAWWPICSPDAIAFERCDGRDEDCDGQIDEGLVRPTACPDGLAGLDRCADGQWVTHIECAAANHQECVARDDAGACTEWIRICHDHEHCDGLDCDCDGAVDEGFDVGAACESGIGECQQPGIRICVDGGAQCHSLGAEASAEVCDGADNDCDGTVDEGFDVGAACENGVGACAAAGTRICRDGESVCDAVAGEPAPELCDGLDNDCNGTIDDGFDVGQICEVEVGGCRPVGTLQCTPDGGVECGVDIERGGEACNGLDDDCDGSVDEGFDVGAACEEGVGACHAEGVMRCNDAGIAECSAEHGAPVEETCDEVDNDCDGSTDEGYALGEDCTVGEGACEAAGTWVCGDDGERVCDAEPGAPSDESCDEVDNDCDGEIDEGLGKGEPCVGGEGPCRQEGVMVCAPGGGVVCSADGADGNDEVCNNIDDDCDGRVDEDVDVRDCGRDIGICESGEEVCQGGQWICRGGVDPSVESCNDLDDDCDGTTDEGFRLGERCTVGVGECRETGSRVCAAGGDWMCDAEPGEPDAERCNDRDDDCDGRTDERLLNACGFCGATPREVCNNRDDDCDGVIDERLTRACGESTGRCERGEQACSRGDWGECIGEVEPRPEVCNGEDDDCDGSTDERVANSCGDCGPVPAEVCDDRDNDCDGSIDEELPQCGCTPEVCDGRDNDCDGSIDERVENACGACGQAPAEVCDNRDNDCDGRTDEGVENRCGGCGPEPAEVCDGQDNDCDGETDEGVENACGGCGQVPAEICDTRDNDCDGRVDEGVLNRCDACGPEPPEACDGRDNDCDGIVDEQLSRGCGSDVGWCQAGEQTCNAGDWGECEGSTGPRPERCNGLDDDCDSISDEALSQACGSDVGACEPGRRLCQNGEWGQCQGHTEPEIEVCDWIDNDCDGLVDEGFRVGEACDLPGVCDGAFVCTQDGGVECRAGAGPIPFKRRNEICNGEDDDCDGNVDEGACPPCEVPPCPL